MQKNLVAGCEYGINPEVQIFKLSSKETLFKFKAQTTIQCIDMQFSRDGKYLLMIGGIPDFKLSIFDLDAGKMINLMEAKLPCG